METRTYKFAELPKEAQAKALDILSYINTEYEGWYEQDGLLDLTKEEMQWFKVKISKNWYESKKPKNTQGNIIGEYPAYTGLIKYKIQAFDLDRDNYIQFSNIVITSGEIFRKFLQLPKRLYNKINYTFINDGERNTRIEFFDNYIDYNNDFPPAEQKLLDCAQSIFAGKVEEALASLKRQHEYLLSKEAIIEAIEANDYNFTLDGNID